MDLLLWLLLTPRLPPEEEGALRAAAGAAEREEGTPADAPAPGEGPPDAEG